MSAPTELESSATAEPRTSPIPVDKIDADAQKVVRRLARAGYEAYFVGGCVRDLLLGRRPKDFDVATSATPQEVKQQFRNCRIIGRRFRLAHVFFGQKIIETATFRANPKAPESGLAAAGAGGAAPPGTRDDENEDADESLLIRHDNVWGTAEEDARRRDFTVNGLFYDLEADRIIDYVGGLADVERRVIRSIGDSNVRFREDPIRILRALKFAARLNFDIDPEAYAAILTHRAEIAKSAAPRVLEELYRLLRGGEARRSLELLDVTGVLGVLSPDLGRAARARRRSRGRGATVRCARAPRRPRAGRLRSVELAAARALVRAVRRGRALPQRRGRRRR